MPLNPAETQWVQGIDAKTGQLVVAAQKLSIKANLADQRIDQAEGRNNLLWGLVATLILGLVGSVGTHLFWAGSVDTTLKAQSKQIEDLQGSVRTLTKDLQEHERRSSTPRPEPTK
jgi:hypothetical protein